MLWTNVLLQGCYFVEVLNDCYNMLHAWNAQMKRARKLYIITGRFRIFWRKKIFYLSRLLLNLLKVLLLISLLFRFSSTEKNALKHEIFVSEFIIYECKLFTLSVWQHARKSYFYFKTDAFKRYVVTCENI